MFNAASMFSTRRSNRQTEVERPPEIRPLFAFIRRHHMEFINRFRFVAISNLEAKMTAVFHQVNRSRPEVLLHASRLIHESRVIHENLYTAKDIMPALLYTHAEARMTSSLSSAVFNGAACNCSGHGAFASGVLCHVVPGHSSTSPMSVFIWRTHKEQ